MSLPVHQPVLPDKVIEFLVTNRQGIYLDGTVGGGGHSELILRELDPLGRVIAVDWDEINLAGARLRLAAYATRVCFIHANFRNLTQLVPHLTSSLLDGLLLDLGISREQYLSPSRGFSFRQPGPLDMRINQQTEFTAGSILNTYSEQELTDLFFTYGQERWSRRIAKAIVKTREMHLISTTNELTELVHRVVPKYYQKINSATRIFQALRIKVNGELDNLLVILNSLRNLIKPGGRVVVISFHSLEDRIVKHTFIQGAKQGFWRVLTKKPVQADLNEQCVNPSARSAKLRAVELI